MPPKPPPPLGPRLPPEPPADEAEERFIQGGAPDASKRSRTFIPRKPLADSAKALITRNDGRVLRRTTVHPALETYERVKAYCDRNRLDMSTVVDEALIEFLDRHDRRE